jgi:hypothetical protein
MGEIVNLELRKIYDQKRATLANEVDSILKEIDININRQKNETYKEIENLTTGSD